jgi:NitT/TauT family transport system substrate-binding protein
MLLAWLVSHCHPTTMTSPPEHCLVMRRRRVVGTVVAATAAWLAAPWVRAQAKPEKPRVRVAVGGRGALYYLPLAVADQLGYFQAEGLQVEVSDFTAGPQALQAVVAAAADVVSGAYENTIEQQSRNQFFQSIVLMGRAPPVALGVSTRTAEAGAAKTVANLRGKRIGVTAPGASSNRIASLMLLRAGVKPQEVNFIGVGASAGAAVSLRNGDIDAICNTDPLMTLLEQKGDVRVVADTRTLKGALDVFGGPMPAGCLYAPQDVVQRHPHTMQALANGIVHALKWLQTAGPGDIIKVVPEAYFLGDRGLYLNAFNKVRESFALDGVMPDNGPQTALNALARFAPPDSLKRVQLERTFTNTFALRARQTHKA